MQYSGPDLDDVKESVRQGVTKVAGRLSSMANDVMSTIQDKYGYWKLNLPIWNYFIFKCKNFVDFI